MVSRGNARLWDGLIEQTPWWWPYIIQIERRLESLRESAAYDPEKKSPPRDLWPMAKSDELESQWFEKRRELAERMAREKQPMQNY